VIKETNANTGNITDYLYGDDLIKQTRAANDSYYLYDGLGSTRALTDSTGSVTDSYDYESFGSVLNQTGSTENNYLFTGEQYDGGLDNYYLRARYHDQNVGRFTQMDTYMGNSQDPITLHKYLYANANPVTYVDPTGNFSLVSFAAADSIRSILAETTVQAGFSILDSAFSDDAESAGPNTIAVGLGIIGGQAGFKLLKMLSSKFRKACKSNSCKLFSEQSPSYFNISKKVSNRQYRHVAGKDYKGGGYLNSFKDAETVLSGFHSGAANIIGKTKNGHLIIIFKGVTGTHVSGGKTQVTNTFLIKGTAKPSIVPTTPGKNPDKLFE
jgi:RHS repeat-associated protein